MQVEGCELLVTESQNLGLKEALKIIQFNFLNYNAHCIVGTKKCLLRELIA